MSVSYGPVSSTRVVQWSPRYDGKWSVSIREAVVSVIVVVSDKGMHLDNPQSGCLLGPRDRRDCMGKEVDPDGTPDCRRFRCFPVNLHCIATMEVQREVRRELQGITQCVLVVGPRGWTKSPCTLYGTLS